MSNSIIRRILILGGLAIIGIVFIQSYLIINTWNQKQNEFNQTVNIALRKVANSIANYNGTKLPKSDLIQRRYSNYYSVNINSVIDANVLEDYLIQTFNDHSLNTNFEYGVYDCATDELLYGDYCVLDNDIEEGTIIDKHLPKFNDLIYYFVVKFPERESYLLSSMRQTILFSIIAFLSVLFFIYAIWVILRQKQLTDLQKDFINNMTHEFKTPISSIKIASEVLKKHPNISKDPRLKNYTNIIATQNERLNNQVEKVLNIARLEVDNFKLKLEDIHLNAFLKNVVEDEKILFEKLDGTIEFNPIQEDRIIKADRLHLTNVISNILDNARKYTAQNPLCSVHILEDNNLILIQIKDNGIGFTVEEQKKIFNKFYRVPTGNVHNVKGFGLGLFYVKNIVDSHDWAIELSSVLNEGSIFTIKIPKII